MGKRKRKEIYGPRKKRKLNNTKEKIIIIDSDNCKVRLFSNYLNDNELKLLHEEIKNMKFQFLTFKIMGKNMIEAVDLTKEFGTFVAVRDLCTKVAEGEVLAFLGPNGAGKTTTVRMLGSILKPTRGYARIAGYDTVKEAKSVRQVIGLLTEFPGLYLRMKGLDYLHFFGELHNSFS